MTQTYDYLSVGGNQQIDEMYNHETVLELRGLEITSGYLAINIKYTSPSLFENIFDSSYAKGCKNRRT